MKRLRELADKHGIVLIADEIQCGFGRTGKLFAMEHHTVRPDLITMAKSLAGGFPLSAVCGKDKIMDAPSPGGLGGTYAANPLAVAAAHAVLDTFDREQLLQRSERLGLKLRNFLHSMQAQHPVLAEVRGVGSMNAVEFANPDTGAPEAQVAQRVQQHALQRGLLLLTCGVDGNVIRFLYPLTIPDQQFDAALHTLGESIRSAQNAEMVA
jgi:4-aminobutyrate aminotransferase